MRRFLLITLILVLVISLAGALASNFLLYDSHQRKQIQLDARATRMNRQEGALLDAESRLHEVERQLDTLEQDKRSLQEQLSTQEKQVATLQAEIARPPIPSPTPPTRPTIFLTAPTAGEQFQERVIVVVRWNAINQDGIGRVTLEVDGRAVAETAIDGTHSAEGEFQWIAVGVGLHQLTVIAANTLGAEGNPATISIEVAPASEPEPSIEQRNAAAMDAIERVVVELRGLEPLRPVNRTFYSQDDLDQFVLQKIRQEYPEDEAERDAIEMAAFDFVPADTDLRALFESLYTEQIAGFYDTDTELLVVVTDNEVMPPLDKTIYAHEFTHALQDQYYNLDTLDPDENSSDTSLAVTALIEGDAMRLQEQYMLRYLDTDELFEMLSELTLADNSVMESAPALIRNQLMFPYEAGLAFVQALYQVGGYQAVDDAFVHPPQSTEQILHPEKYLAGEAPQAVSVPPLTETLSSGWRWVGEDVLGEFTLRLYLEQTLSTRRATAAAAGWGGDRYVVYQHQESGAILMVMRTAWDTSDEAAEFMDAYQTFGTARFGVTAEETATTACWHEDGATCIFQAERETLIIRAPSPELIATLEALFPDFTRNSR